jgi:hypothetical protein
MREKEIINLSLNNYRLASSFSREEFSKGVVCIMTRNGINFNKIYFNKIRSEKTFEIMATKLNTKMRMVIICGLYRSTSGNLNQFFKLLEETLKGLYQLTLTLSTNIKPMKILQGNC